MHKKYYIIYLSPVLEDTIYTSLFLTFFKCYESCGHFQFFEHCFE